MLRKSFFVFLFLDFAALGFIVYQEHHYRQWVVELRNAIFTDFVSSPSALEAQPSQLLNEGYLVDSPEVIADWRKRLNQMPVYRDLFRELEKTSPTIDKAKAIVLSFSRNGSVEAFDQKADLTYKLEHISDPYGVCSDHVEVFQALASVAGLASVEIATGAHNTCNFYAPELRRWLWIDPHYALMAKDSHGNYLSTCQIRDCFLRNQKVDFEFFGLPEHKCATVSPLEFAQYQPSTYVAQMFATWGSNVLTFDGYRSKMLLLPKSVRQSVFMLLGIKPSYRRLADGFPVSIEKRRVHTIAWMMICGLIIGTLLFPLFLLMDASKLVARWLGYRLRVSGILVADQRCPAPIKVDSEIVSARV